MVLGLYNFGTATCYLNVCLQFLLYSPEVIQILLEHEPRLRNLEAGQISPNRQKEDPRIGVLEKKLLCSFLDIYHVFHSPNSMNAIAPTRFYQTLKELASLEGYEFQFGGQQDMSECILFLIKHFHQSLWTAVRITITGTPQTEQDTLAVLCYSYLNEILSKEYSPLYTLFHGVKVQVLTGKISNIPRRKPDAFSVLTLNIPPQLENVSVLDCLQYYLEPEILDGVNYENKEKGINLYESAEKRNVIWSFPPLLVLEIKRIYDYPPVKNNIFVSYSKQLDLSSYVADFYPNKYQYELYAVINHYGNAQGGHYTIFVRDASSSWLHINDELVTSIKEEDAINSVHATCLIYRRPAN